MEFSFETEVIHWRGPAPFFFAPVPDAHVADITRARLQAVAERVGGGYEEVEWSRDGR